MDLVIITPVRNEEEYLGLTIESMARQTLRPKLWVLVDDGSTDRTGSIIDEAAKTYSWVKAVHRSDRGYRLAGEGVIGAFCEGLQSIGSEAWDYLAKFDGDLSFAPDYFEKCIEKFQANPKLGIGGGTICNRVNGVLSVESSIDPEFHVRGATKIYRRQCWNQIGGLIRAAGWDTVDELKANMLGWVTRTFPDIPVVHHRPAGQAYGCWNGWVKNGKANYVAGYHPVFMALKCMRRLFAKPYLVGSCGLFAGYFGAYLRRAPRVLDQELIQYFRHQQMNRLLGRKSLWD